MKRLFPPTIKAATLVDVMNAKIHNPAQEETKSKAPGIEFLQNGKPFRVLFRPKRTVKPVQTTSGVEVPPELS